MTSMERETLSYFGKEKTSLHFHHLAICLKISDHYAFVIYKGLERSGYLVFDEFRGLGTLTEKGKNFVFKSHSDKDKRLKEFYLNKKKTVKKKYTKKITKIEY
jgi:Mn-dependent DtxR family transcriptional regulator